MVHLTSSTPKGVSALAIKLLSTQHPSNHAQPSDGISSSTKPTPSRFSSWRRLSPALGWVAAAIIATLLVPAYLTRNKKADSIAAVNRLISIAYSEKRPFEPRVPGANLPAKYRGGRNKLNSETSQSLKTADYEIGEHLAKSPNDLAWLQAKGRVDLLNQNYELSIETLQKVIDADPHATEALTDQATAYYMLAETAQGKPDQNKAEILKFEYSRAYELLSKVLALKPDDLVALFNRPIVGEKIPLYTDGIADCNRYLQLDPTSPWAEEVRLRLSQLQKASKGRAEVSKPPQKRIGESPSAFVPSRPELENHLESNFEKALTSWLTKAYPYERKLPQSEIIKAQSSLRRLARLLAVCHNDHWLGDFLASSEADAEFNHSVLWIAKGYEANSRGDYATAMEFARKAGNHFGKTQNGAGSMISSWEGLYAVRLSYRAEECSHRSASLWSRLAETSYYWLQARVSLDYAQCAEVSHRLQLAARLANTSGRISQEHGFPDLYLRAVKVAGDLALLTEDPERAFNIYERGLTQFWASGLGYMPGYNLYSGLDDGAQLLGFWYLDISVIKEALALAEHDPDLGMRAVMHQRMAVSMLMVGDSAGAAMHMKEAGTLFARLRPDETVRSKLAEVTILMAHLSLLRGQPKEALAKLETVRSEVGKLGDHDISFDYYCTAGLAADALGRSSQAYDHLKSAIGLAEMGLQTVATEHERLLWSRRFGPAYRGMVRLELRRNPEAAFAWWEWYKGASGRFSDTTRRSPEFHVSSIYRGLAASGQVLGPHRIVLSYAVFPEGSAAWTYDGNTVGYKWIPVPTGVLNTQSRKFAELCADPNSDLPTLHRAAIELSRLLVEPVKPFLKGHPQVILEGDGALDRIPFDALVDSTGRYLAETFTFTYSPGLSYSGRYPTNYVSSESRALIIADPTPRPEFNLLSLPDVEMEGQMIAGRFRYATTLVGDRANEATFKQKLRTAELVHFAGHSIVSVNGSALVLQKSKGGKNRIVLFSAEDFTRCSLQRTKLVVLSACASALGPEGGLSESNSLARSLVSSGVPQVIASRWPVYSSPTRALMEDFYISVTTGHSVSEALHHTEENTRAKKELCHPFYWAAFSLFASQ
jgi:tetratricopeptide (TPR) repeat protein